MHKLYEYNIDRMTIVIQVQKQIALESLLEVWKVLLLISISVYISSTHKKIIIVIKRQNHLR